MKVITITPITDAMLVSSTAPETDYAAYAAGTTYAVGDRVIRTTGVHRIFESLAASNVGNTPETSPLKWQDIGPTNRWACFDAVIGTTTTVASPLVIVIAPGMVNALALLEMVGTSVTVAMTSASEGGATVYSQTISLDASPVLDYYDFFFAPFAQRTSVVLTDLPPYSDGVITITLTGGTVSLGVLATGRYTELGDAQYGATAGINSFSVKTVDGFGNTTVSKRPNSTRQSFKLWLTKGQFNSVYRKLKELDSVLCVWVGTDDPDYAEGLIAYGFFKTFQLEVSYPKRSLCSLETEGVT